MQLIWLFLISFSRHEHRSLFTSPRCASWAGVIAAIFSSTAALVTATSSDKLCATSSDDVGACLEEATNNPDSLKEEKIDPSEQPIWWNYSIDDLFEKYFHCGEILYGYGSDLRTLYGHLPSQTPEKENEYEDDFYEYEDEADEDFFDDEDENEDYDIEEEWITSGKEKLEKPTQTGATHSTISSQLSPEWWEEHRKFLRKEFTAIRDKYREEVNLVPVREGEFNSVMSVPVYVGDAFEKGRGVFAAEPIKKGTLVSNLDNDHVGIFKEGHSWRKFAVSLPRGLACNFIEWSWVQDMPPLHEDDNDVRNGLTIFVAFDESNLINNAEWGEEEANIRCGTPPKSWLLNSEEIKNVEDDGEDESSNDDDSEDEDWGPCRYHSYATRDIAAGEEILIKYSEFEEVSQQGWEDIGL